MGEAPRTARLSESGLHPGALLVPPEVPHFTTSHSDSPQPPAVNCQTFGPKTGFDDPMAMIASKAVTEWHYCTAHVGKSDSGSDLLHEAEQHCDVTPTTGQVHLASGRAFGIHHVRHAEPLPGAQDLR